MAARVVPLAKTDSRRQGQLFVALAALAWSSSGVLQRELTIDTATQLAGRALFAFLFLAAVVLVSARGRVVLPIRSMGLTGFGVAICTAVASGSFIVALNHAKVANVLFMQAIAPIAAALLAWTALGERVTQRTWVAMAVAVLGAASTALLPSLQLSRIQRAKCKRMCAFAGPASRDPRHAAIANACAPVQA